MSVREVLEWDWAQTLTGLVLHHVAHLDDAEQFEYEGGGGGKTTCGVVSRLNIPGLFSRMGQLRCRKCCRMLGVPVGVGSPKNDEAIRPCVEERLTHITDVGVP